MPRKLLNVKESIQGTNTPVMVFLSEEEVANQTTELRAFKLDDEGTILVSNLQKLFNPVDGSIATPMEQSNQKIAGDEYRQLNDLASMKSKQCKECTGTAGVDPDIAFSIADEPMYCPQCGKETAFVFEDEEDLTDTVTTDDDDTITDVDDTEDENDGPEADDEDDLADADDNTEEVYDDETLTGDEDDEDEDEELAAAGKKSKKSKKDKPVKKSSETASDPIAADPVDKPVDAPVNPAPEKPAEPAPSPAPEPKPEEKPVDPQPDQANDSGGQPKDNAPIAEQPDVTPVVEPITDPNLVYEKLDAASLADKAAPIKLVTLSADNSEIAVFVGDSHVGTLRRSQASEKVNPLFADGYKLAAAFKPVFKANLETQTSRELAAYGYKPVVYEVSVGDLFQRRIDKEVAAVQTKATDNLSVKVKNIGSMLELAFTGINKGIFKGNTDLLNAIETALQRGGIKDAKAQARRIVSSQSHQYIKLGVEKAMELSEKPQEYINGITETISQAVFSEPISEEIKIDQPPVVQIRPANEVASADFVGSREQQVKDSNKFSGLIRSFRR